MQIGEKTVKNIRDYGVGKTNQETQFSIPLCLGITFTYYSLELCK
jgi:hypothetical protein